MDKVKYKMKYDIKKGDVFFWPLEEKNREIKIMEISHGWIMVKVKRGVPFCLSVKMFIEAIEKRIFIRKKDYKLTKGILKKYV